MNLQTVLNDLFRIARHDERLMVAQLEAMERQIPLLYIIIAISTIGLGAHFFYTAPVGIAVGVPAGVTGFIILRMLAWMRRDRSRKPLKTIHTKLKLVVILTALITLFLCAWAWSLDFYATDFQRAHLAFYVAVTVITTVLALAQFPPGAMAAVIFGGMAYLAYSCSKGSLAQIGLGLNMVLVLTVTVALLHAAYKSFRRDVHAQEHMERANEKMSELNSELIFHRDNLQEEVRRRTAEIQTQALQLEQALSQEKELNRMQNKFVSMVSHEFRTPLTVIDATARRVESRIADMPDDEVGERMARIRGSVKRLSGLVERTLDAAKMANGSIEYVPSEFDPRALLSEIVERHREIAPDKKFHTRITNPPDTMHGDPQLIDHILSNLISNAIKYAPDDPNIEITFQRTGERVQFVVRDHGVGIPKDEMKNVSNRFFRASTSAGISGTGIGLNLVSTLVDMHSGCMRIESEEGQWTEVTINLPINGRDCASDCPKITGQSGTCTHKAQTERQAEDQHETGSRIIREA